MHAEIVNADAGESGLFALRVFVRPKKESLVFFERAAKSESALRARVRLLDGIQRSSYRIDLAGKRVACLERFIAQKAENVTVKVITAAFAHDVDDAAAGAAVFGVVVAQNELKFLDALLRERRANGVDGVVDGVCAVNTDRGPTRARPPNA